MKARGFSSDGVGEARELVHLSTHSFIWQAIITNTVVMCGQLQARTWLCVCGMTQCDQKVKRHIQEQLFSSHCALVLTSLQTGVGKPITGVQWERSLLPGADGCGEVSDSGLGPCTSPALQEFSGNTEAGHRVVEQKNIGRVLCSLLWYDIGGAT